MHYKTFLFYDFFLTSFICTIHPPSPSFLRFIYSTLPLLHDSLLTSQQPHTLIFLHLRSSPHPQHLPLSSSLEYFFSHFLLLSSLLHLFLHFSSIFYYSHPGNSSSSLFLVFFCYYIYFTSHYVFIFSYLRIFTELISLPLLCL